MMNDITRLILSLSLSASILAIIIFVIKPFIRYKISKTIQYYIWIVVLLRLVIPFTFEESIMNNVFYGPQTAKTITTQAIAMTENNVNKTEVDSSILANVRQNVKAGMYNYDTDHSRFLKDLLGQYVIYAWLLGVIIMLTINISSYIGFLKGLKGSNKPASNEENDLLKHLLNGRKNVRLVRNSLVTTPMLIGIIRPCIIIPDIEFSSEALKNILLHEISHLKSFDILVKWLTLIATSIHWFNPLVYLIKNEINHACELACDETVIRNLSNSEKQCYGDTLISVVSENKYSAGVLQATMSEQKETLKERLVAIMKFDRKSKSLVLLSIGLLLVVVGGAIALGAYRGDNIKQQAVVNVVEEFGGKLKMVSLLAPNDILVQSIQENYSPYVTQNLLNKWLNDPTNAPGRLVSSPWPERIEILTVKRLAGDRYEVKANIIEVTAVEEEQGGVAAKRSITLQVIKLDGRWLIDDVILGEYIKATDVTAERLEQMNMLASEIAREIINRDIEHQQLNPEVEILDSKVTRLELIETVESLTDTPLYVYALEYRLLPQDLSKVIMAGGMLPDEEGWLTESCSMGSPLIVITYDEGEARHIGNTWTGNAAELGSLEDALIELLERS